MSAIDDLPAEARALCVAADVPDVVEPELATLVAEPFSKPGWVFEPKYDGVRLLAVRSDDGVRLVTRNRNRVEETYPEITDAISALASDALVLDGEVVAFAGGEVTSFARLQRRMHVVDRQRALRVGVPVFYYVFDLLHLDGWDTTRLPLLTRKELLRIAVPLTEPLRFSGHLEQRGEAFFAEACRRGWEGLIAKRADSPYRSGRTRDWLKLKCTRRQDVVVGGWTEPRGSRPSFGALLLGVYDDGAFVYVGKVGTGFDQATLTRLHEILTTLTRNTSPFERGDPPRAASHWCEPELVAVVEFGEWTPDGRLRHPRFVGVRADQDPTEVHRSEPAERPPT